VPIGVPRRLLEPFAADPAAARRAGP
jgi:hypothetical protein